MSSKKEISLSKSRYCNWVQCPRMLWLLDHNKEEWDETVLNERIIEQGHKVGDLAQEYFATDITIPYNQDKSRMIMETKNALDKKEVIIAEASFANNRNFCSVDILKVSNNYTEIVEVKSSTELKNIYLHDVAYQYYVLTSEGLKIKKASVMYINNNYTRKGELNLQELFTIEDCTDTVRKMQKSIAENIEEIKRSQKSEPVQDIGHHCKNPYECGFIKHCWKHIPKNSIFNIAKLRSEKKFNYYQQGIISFQQAFDSGITLNSKQLQQVETELKKSPPVIQHKKIQLFLKTLSYPMYFLDFETYMAAIPPFDKTRPYMQIPFQYSLHILEKKKGILTHREFLAKEGTDPRRQLAENLCQDIPIGVCVVAYNMSFEKGRLEELAALFPDLSSHLMEICESMKDLMQPFQSRAYYRREFAGSYSIKVILPTLYPNNKELDYSNLETIHKGDEAMGIFPTLHEKTAEEINKIRKALLAYCRLDTLGMVKIMEFLENI